MKLITSKILKVNKSAILENVRQASTYAQQGKLSKDVLKSLIEIDPTSTRKYVGWMAKQWISNNVDDLDTLRNIIEEYDTFLQKGKAKTKDINQFKSFEDLQKEVDTLNQSGDALSSKDLESDYETIVDSEDLLIISPHTHEASRKLGLSHFAYRSCSDGTKDSAWCTTYKAPDHFNDYYYKRNVTFYYIKVRSPKLIAKIKERYKDRWESMLVTAIAVLPNGQMDGYDGLDKQFKGSDLKDYLKILNIS